MPPFGMSLQYRLAQWRLAWLPLAFLAFGLWCIF